MPRQSPASPPGPAAPPAHASPVLSRVPPHPQGLGDAGERTVPEPPGPCWVSCFTSQLADWEERSWLVREGARSTPLSCQSLPAPSVPHQRAPAVVGAGHSDRNFTQRAIGEAQGLLPLPLKAHRLSPRQPKKHRIWAHGQTRAPLQPREEQRAEPAALRSPRWEGGDPELGERPRAPSSLLSTSCLPPSHPRGGQPCPYLRGDAVRLCECPQSTFLVLR